ncbi:hypothetical protein [Deinococcus sp.]|uniref:hypothetical protein n=1 Tax=Deinococcus sp. TaxID=47478 RepID=UPI002869E6A5|nr:hypothetical protein [Deinococcus sp.]
MPLLHSSASVNSTEGGETIGRLQELWGVLNAPIHLRTREPPAETRPGANAAAATVRGLRSAGGRVSSPGIEAGFGSTLVRLEGAFPGYPANSRRRVIRLMRWLTQRDEDMNGSLRDQIAIANPGHTLEFVGGKRAVQAAQAEIQAFAERVFPEGGGLDGLNNNQVGEIVRTGATSLEWYALSSRRGLENVAVVPAEDIKIRRTESGLLYTQQTTVTEPIDLPALTYRYLPILTDGADPYGIPLFIAALEAAERKVRLSEGVDRVVDMMRVLAFVSATFPEPTPEELGLTSKADPQYGTLTAEYFAQAAALVYDNAPKGLMVGPSGSEFKVTNVTQSLAGLPELLLENNRRLWTATRTLPMMRGHMDSTTEALAKVVYPMIEAEAGNIQMVLARQLEHGLNLHLRLRGIPAQVWVRFQQAESAFALAQAQTEYARMQTDEVGKRVFGNAWWPKAAQRWDIAKEDVDQAPDWWLGDTPVPANIPLLNGDTAARSVITYDRQARRYREIVALTDIRTA